MEQIESLFQFSHIVKIYVPGTFNVNTPAADLQKIETEKAINFMAGVFGGATCGQFTGAWIDEAGQTIVESQNIIYSYFDGDLEKVSRLIEYAENLCKTMKQDCISIEFDGRLAFVPAK